MNLDFGAEPLFSWYVVLLCLSGITMFVLSAIGRSGQSTGVRVFTALVGAAFLGYGVYLALIFTGGTYLIVFKAFILPALLLVNFLRALATRHKPQPTPPYAPHPHSNQPYAPNRSTTTSRRTTLRTTRTAPRTTRGSRLEGVESCHRAASAGRRKRV